jgi:hypothetical protein
MQTTSKLLVSFLLCLILFSVSGCGDSSGGKKTASVAKAYVEAIIREEADILDLDSRWWKDGDFHQRNSDEGLYDIKKDGLVVAKPGFEHTKELHSTILFPKTTLGGYDKMKAQSIGTAYKNSHRKKVRELIGLAIEEIEKAGEQSSVFDDWKRSQGSGQ